MKQIMLVLIIGAMSSFINAQSPLSKTKNVVFIHGAWSTGDVWGKYETYFSKKGFHMFSPTLSGHLLGKKDSLIGVSIEDYVNEIRVLLKTFNSPPIVIAHSMGCIIAQRLATEGLVEQMILIAPPVNLGMMPPSESIESIKWINEVKKLKTQVVKPSFELATKGMLQNLSKDKQKEMYSKVTSESGLALKEMIWIKNLFGKKPNRIKYAKVDQPILFISGGLDQASPTAIAEKLSKKYKSNVKLKVFEKNGHWMMEEENWLEIAVYIERWIRLK
jgi:non-heme chloroperoxidase